MRCDPFWFGGVLELFGSSLQRCLRFRLGWGGDVSWVVEAVRCVALDLYRVLDLSAAECVFSIVSGWVLYCYDAVVVEQAFFVVVYDGDGEDELEVSAEEYDRGVVGYRLPIELLLVLLLEHPGWVLVQVRLEGFDGAEGLHREVLRPSCKPEDRSQITSTSYRGRFTSQLSRTASSSVSRGNDRKSGEAPNGTRSALSSSAALISIVINDVAVRPPVLS